MRKSTIYTILFLVIVIGIITGILVHIYNDDKVEKAQINQTDKLDKLENKTQVVETVSTKVKASPNAVVTYETYYKKCGHLIVEKKAIEAQEVNETEDYFKDKYSDWTIKKFETNEIELYKEVDDICNKHYVLREQNGYIAIYTLDGNGQEKLKENTDISTQYLPKDDIELLKKGVKANGDSELAEKLSDFE